MGFYLLLQNAFTKPAANDIIIQKIEDGRQIMQKSAVKGYIFAMLSAIIYGCMPLMASRVYADGVNPQTLVFLRNFFSIIPLAILALRERGTLKIPVKALPSISIISLLGCTVTPMLLFASYRFISSGTATVFHFIYPAAVVIAEIFIKKSKVNKGNLISVILCVLGIGLFYSPSETLNFNGSALALLSGITFASYVIMLSHFDTSVASGFLFTFYVTCVSTILTFIFCIASGSLILPATLGGWLLCILFSLLVTTGAVMLFQQSAFLIGSERTSILSTLEPITSIVIGIAFLGEALTLRTVIGSSLVICASIIIAVSDLVKKD